MLIPGVATQALEAAISSAQIWKGTGGSTEMVMSICCVMAPLLQKLPRKTTSSCEATRRGALSIWAIWNTVTPAEEIE